MFYFPLTGFMFTPFLFSKAEGFVSGGNGWMDPNKINRQLVYLLSFSPLLSSPPLALLVGVRKEGSLVFLLFKGARLLVLSERTKPRNSKKILGEMNELLIKGEILWKQRSRLEEMKRGDCNPVFSEEGFLGSKEKYYLCP